jgi:acetate kinase
VRAPEGRGGADALRAFAAGAPPVAAAAHRFVHGGPDLREPVAIDTAVAAKLSELAELAPLQTHAALACLRALEAARPDLRQVACFDTAFHASLPAAAATYAVPRDWTERLGVRRYGFHGLSHAYASRRAAELTGRSPAELRVVTCHLGAGASLAAVAGGRSVDTTMGMTPNDGIVMATRSGAVDPSALLWVVERTGMPAEEARAAIEHEGGLLALAGTADMREVLAEAERGEPRAVLARDVYVHRLRAGVAAMAAAMGGLDALVFTGGVGENSAEIRDRACEGLAFLGIGSSVEVLVIPAREELELAAEARRLVARG